MEVTHKTLFLLAYLLGAGSLPTRAQVRQLRPLPVEETLETWSIPLSGAPISLSPDGRWVAYALQKIRRLGTPAEVRYSLLTPTGVPRGLVGSDIWIVNTQTGTSRNLTNREGTSWAPVWSPDGRYLAFTSDRNGSSDLWLWDKSSGKERRATGESLNAIGRSYQWTPDSKHILVRVLPDGMNLENFLDFAYGPRNQRSRRDTETRPTAVIKESRVVPSLPGERQSATDSDKFYDLRLSDLVLIDIDSGKPRRVARKLRLGSFVVSPDGTHVAMMSYTGQAAVNSQRALWELSIASLVTNDSKIVDRNLWWEDSRPMKWSLDGESVVYETNSPHDKHEVHLFSLNGGESRNLVLPSDFATPDHAVGAPWLWNKTGQTLYWITKNVLWKVTLASGEYTKIADISGHTLFSLIPARGNLLLWSSDGDRSAVVLARDDQTRQEGFYRIDLISGQFTNLFEEPKTIFGGPGLMDASDDQRTLAYLAEGVQSPDDIWIVGPDMRNPRPATITNPVFSQYVLGTSRLIRWKSFDGEDLRGAVVLPAGYEEGKRYPLIVYVYGGIPLSTALNEWGGGPVIFNMQILSTRGYAVLFPDAPQHVGTPMQDLAKTILPGVQKVVDLGIADPNRLGVMGHSYGGYSTLALIEQSKQFRAAVDISGPVNLMNAYVKTGIGGGSIGWVENGQGAMGGSLWDYRERFIENSPLFYLDRIQTPVLIIHGESDQTVPVEESRIVFESLRRLGREAVYVEYEGEEHRISQWNYANQVDFCNRVIAWFSEYLKAN